jgi:hypothetical protein
LLGSDAEVAVTVNVSAALTLLGALYLSTAPLALVAWAIPPQAVTPEGQAMVHLTPLLFGSFLTVAVSESAWPVSMAGDELVSATLIA